MKQARYLDMDTGEIYPSQRAAVDAWLAGETIKAYFPGSNTVLMWEHDEVSA